MQQALLANIRQFLLELGISFTFVGSNYHIEVGEEDYYIDDTFHLPFPKRIAHEIK